MAGSAETLTKSRKGSTPSGTSSQPHRPQPPKRAHTSAASTITLNSAKRNAPGLAASAERRGPTPQLVPLLTPQVLQPSHSAAPKTPSPNYFGLVVEPENSNPNDSDAGKHAKKNWTAYSSNSGPGAEVPVEENPQFETFRQRSEQNTAFRLAHSNLSRFSTEGHVPTLKALSEHRSADGHVPAGARSSSFQSDKRRLDPMDTDQATRDGQRHDHGGATSFFDMPMQESPHPDSRPGEGHRALSKGELAHPQGSVPHTRVTTPIRNTASKPRSEPSPAELNADTPSLLSASGLSELLASEADSTLLLDLRVAPQYAQSRVRGALNLCLPTTLLKRPAFNIRRLADTFTSPDEKTRFGMWRDASHIVVYDACSSMLKDAQSSINTLKKFRSEGYTGETHIVKGGFNAVVQRHPHLVESANAKGPNKNPGLKLAIGSNDKDSGAGGTQVAGGCPMPSEQPANPFFGNIRQNMDLVDGVGQMPIKRPTVLTSNNVRGLPSWLQDIVDDEDEGKEASEKFLKIEQTEQKRMQQALSGRVQYGTPMPREQINGEAKQGRVQVAGIEKGSKNRYKDMLPYEHARVRLRHFDSDGCDYINASHIKAEWCNRRYIATQAPVPATFKDFWRLVWEQDVRVLVMLTAELENGQRKCHKYWEPDSYGPFKLKLLSEKRVSLELPSRASLIDPSRKASMPVAALHDQRRFQRRATLALNADEADRPLPPPQGGGESEAPYCVVRKLTLSHTHEPFKPIREVAQVQYTNWPDFGAPAEPAELLALVEQVDLVVRGIENGGKGMTSRKPDTGFASSLADEEAARWPAAEGEHPVVVHCSAGCGRSGTFITVDAVIDMLKRQRSVAIQRRSEHGSRSGFRIPVPQAPRERETNPFDMLTSPTSKATAQVDAMELDDRDSEESSPASSSGSGDEGKPLNEQAWVARDDIDLVQKAVEDLRLQRLSMVQNLRQYTLCYESVIEWLVREMPERFRREHFRKSYQG